MQPECTEPHDRGTVYYAEDWCAMRWPVWFHAIAAPALAVALLVLAGATGAPGFGFIAVGAWMWAFAAWRRLYNALPTGIRVDAGGIRIGGVRRAERQSLLTRLKRRPASIIHQSHAVFTCPWTATWQLAVVADHRRMGEIRRQASKSRGRSIVTRTTTPLGWLAAPWMRGCLVIYIVPGEIELPMLRPVLRERRHSLLRRRRRGEDRFYVADSGALSPTWLAPTRHPAVLLAALRRIPGCRVKNHIPADAPIELYPRRWR